MTKNDTGELEEDVEVELALASLASADSADSAGREEGAPPVCLGSRATSKGFFRIGVAVASTIAVLAAIILIATLPAKVTDSSSAVQPRDDGALTSSDGVLGRRIDADASTSAEVLAVVENNTEDSRSTSPSSLLANVAEDSQPTYSPSRLLTLPTVSPTYSPASEDELSFGVESYYGASSFTDPIDFFLLGGQSNMVGHSTSSQSLGAILNKEANSQYWFDMKAILEAANESNEEREAALFDSVYQAHANRDFENAAEIAGTLARETMQLYREGLLADLDSPPDLGSCSFLEPLKEKYDDNQRPMVENTSSGIQPLVPGSSCGHSFGHELLFGRTLELQLAQGNRYEMVKYASGATSLSEHWLPGKGTFWDGLNSTIHSRQGYGNWKAFVWHQGESSAFPSKGEDRSLTYLGDLTAFVKAVRDEMHSASPGFWSCPEAIPVVIVQLGAWPTGIMAERVREAQAQFCESDARSGLITMGDLSPFYHFDPLSLLISGNRIAKAYDLIRSSQSEYVCPGGIFSVLVERLNKKGGKEGERKKRGKGRKKRRKKRGEEEGKGEQRD